MKPPSGSAIGALQGVAGVEGEPCFSELLGCVQSGSAISGASGEVIPRTTVSAIYGVGTNHALDPIWIRSELVRWIWAMTHDHSD